MAASGRRTGHGGATRHAALHGLRRRRATCTSRKPTTTPSPVTPSAGFPPPPASSRAPSATTPSIFAATANRRAPPVSSARTGSRYTQAAACSLSIRTAGGCGACRGTPVSCRQCTLDRATTIRSASNMTSPETSILRAGVELRIPHRRRDGCAHPDWRHVQCAERYRL